MIAYARNYALASSVCMLYRNSRTHILMRSDNVRHISSICIQIGSYCPERTQKVSSIQVSILKNHDESLHGYQRNGFQKWEISVKKIIE